jgi:hypothetical protein
MTPLNSIACSRAYLRSTIQRHKPFLEATSGLLFRGDLLEKLVASREWPWRPHLRSSRTTTLYSRHWLYCETRPCLCYHSQVTQHVVVVVVSAAAFPHPPQESSYRCSDCDHSESYSALPDPFWVLVCDCHYRHEQHRRHRKGPRNRVFKSFFVLLLLLCCCPLVSGSILTSTLVVVTQFVAPKQLRTFVEIEH